MDCTCGRVAGFHEDQVQTESPVVISSYAFQLELGCIGRDLNPYAYCVCLCMCVRKTEREREKETYGHCYQVKVT